MTAHDEIRALIRERVDAIARRDAGALAAREAPDVRTFNVLPPLETRGDEAVVAQLDAWLDAYSRGPDYDVTGLTTEVSDGLACAAFLYHVGGTLRSGDDVDMWVRATLVYRRIDGEWRIVHDHESVPFDAATGRALTGLEPADVNSS